MSEPSIGVGTALPVAPSLDPALLSARVPRAMSLVEPRMLFVSALSVGVAIAVGFVARALLAMIALVTNLAFMGRISLEPSAPAQNHWGLLVIGVPVLGGIVVGLMARYGSKAIRGHGIPEAMEQVLTNESRIPARLTFLKPISAAIAIGTGGPFGAEGPIIATGGALGSLVGQLLHTSSVERKTLLAAGAAAGMAATFGSPVSAVLLAVELLLFEFRARSLIPVALASVSAAGVRMALVGSAPVFAMPTLQQPGTAALTFYVLLGAVMGVAAIAVTRAVYAVEDAFEKLPVHWMWWPALGGLAVGVVGYFSPLTMGVGYSNIERVLTGSLAGRTLLLLFVLKFVSWSVALGSGTSGGTLAPLFTIGGGLGASLGALAAAFLPSCGIDPRIAGLVGMAAIFAGASRALLASVVFAFETTLQPLGLLPLLGGCTAAYLVSCYWMRNTIMTEKVARRGVRVPSEYAADYWEQILVRQVMQRQVVTLTATDTLLAVRAWLTTRAPGTEHQGFPVLDAGGRLLGLITRRELAAHGADDVLLLGGLLKHAPTVAFETSSLREAADLMARDHVGRLPVVSVQDRSQIVGIVTHSDLFAAHALRLRESERSGTRP